MVKVTKTYFAERSAFWTSSLFRILCRSVLFILCMGKLENDKTVSPKVYAQYLHILISRCASEQVGIQTTLFFTQTFDIIMVFKNTDCKV